MSTIYKIQLRRGLAADWTLANPTLGDGEPGYEKDTNQIKMGDGVTPWVELPYNGIVDLSHLAPIDSPEFTGVPTAPTPSVGDSSTKLATTEFVSSFTLPDGEYVKTSGDAMSGNLTIRNAAAASILKLDPVGPSKVAEIDFGHDGAYRWLIRTTNTTEPDSSGLPNSGSDLQIASRHDDSSPRGTPLVISRRTGVSQFQSPIAVKLGTGPVYNPNAASVYSNVSHTGYLLIKIPAVPDNLNAQPMSQFIIKGYDYTTRYDVNGGGTGQWQLTLGGFQYRSGGGWQRCSARAEGMFPGNVRKLPVRFMYKGVDSDREFAIAIGDATTAWTYLNVVMELIAGYSGMAIGLESGYQISCVASISDWTAPIVFTPETNDPDWVSYNPTITGFTASSIDARYHYTQGGLVTVNAAFAVATQTGSLTFTVPVVPLSTSVGTGHLSDTSGSNYLASIIVRKNNTQASIYAIALDSPGRITNTQPFAWAAGDNIYLTLTYEAAPN